MDKVDLLSSLRHALRRHFSLVAWIEANTGAGIF